MGRLALKFYVFVAVLSLFYAALYAQETKGAEPEKGREKEECSSENLDEKKVLSKALDYLGRAIPNIRENVGTPWKPSLYALVGLAFAASDERKYQELITSRIIPYLKQYVDSVYNIPEKDCCPMQSVWPISFTGIAFLEFSKRGYTEVNEYFSKIISILEKNQRKNGSWTHNRGWQGYGNTEALSSLIACTNWAAAALGLLSKDKYKVPKGLLDKTYELYKTAQLRDGGFPYSPPQNAGSEPGRTSGAVFALCAMGKDDTLTYTKAARFLMKKLPATPYGHASSTMHTFTGALATFTMGNKHYEKYYKTFKNKILCNQLSDGSFKDFVTDTFSTDEPSSELVNMLKFKQDYNPQRIYITANYVLFFLTPKLKVLQGYECGKNISDIPEPDVEEPRNPFENLLQQVKFPEEDAKKGKQGTLPKEWKNPDIEKILEKFPQFKNFPSGKIGFLNCKPEVKAEKTAGGFGISVNVKCGTEPSKTPQDKKLKEPKILEGGGDLPPGCKKVVNTVELPGGGTKIEVKVVCEQKSSFQKSEK